jgi:hypothetical protein
MFLAFVCSSLALISATCPPTKPTEPKIEYVYMQREPVTLEIINDMEIKNELTLADFYLSVSINLFFPALVEERHIVVGDYERRSYANTSEVSILYNHKGKYVSHTNNRIDVSFENIILRFVRVSGRQVNHYELDSAQRDNRTLEIFFPYDKPYLVIHTKEIQNRNIIPAQGITPRGNNQSNAGQSGTKIHNLNVLSTGDTPKLNENYIIAIADYICNTRTPRIPYSVAGSGFDRSSVVQIVSFYFEEAEREDINPDLAVAQMIWSMQYFSDAKAYRELREAHNYGRLVFTRNLRNDYWDGKTFTGRNVSERRRNGIRAHIQFLRRSAIGSLKSSHAIVLPMPIWNELADAAGKRQTLADISKSWGGSNPTIYEKNISDVYEKLTSHLGIRI